MPLSSGAFSAPLTTRPLLDISLVVVLVVSAIGIAARPGLAADPPGRDEQLRFMWAMAGQESGWDYHARNTSSGAFGKYQIMPSNWPVWAGKYIGDRRADQTPYNQEQVAYGKLRDLYTWLGSWKRVAYWWLTGSSEKNERQWSSYAKGYVRNVMKLRKRAPTGGSKMPPRTSSRSTVGDWRRSAGEQTLHLAVAGQAWPERGTIRDGQVLKVKAARSNRNGVRWIRVLTADGRLGWLGQSRTVPAHQPTAARRWAGVNDDGRSLDRGQVRPRPR